jgi:hypothetical protein
MPDDEREQDKSLRAMSDEELGQRIRHAAEHVIYSASSYNAEWDRRERRRETRRSFALSLVAVLVSAISLTVTVLSLLFRPPR